MFGLIAMAAGALINAYNKKHTLDKQNAALDQALGHQGDAQRQIGQALNQGADQFPMQAHAGAPTADYLQAVRNALGTHEVPDYGLDAYQQATAAHQAEDAAHTGQLAQLMGATDAVPELHQQQTVAYNDLAQRIAALAGQAQGQHHVDQIGLAGIHENPGLSLIGNGLMSYGMSNASFGGGGKKALKASKNGLAGSPYQGYSYDPYNSPYGGSSLIS